MTTYTPDERSKAKRYAKRVNYEQEAVSSIVKHSPLCHVSFNAPPQDGGPQFPTILPMLAAMSTSPNDTEPHIYLHGSSAARLMRLGSEPLPVCIAATILDGYVLALTPFNHSCNYRSAVIFGYAERVTQPEEVLFAMELITNSLVPDRWVNSRTPPTKPEITATGILKVRVETASVKVREGGPHDDRKDLRDEEVVGRVWTGTVPVYQVLGEAVANEENKVKEVPAYVGEWVEGSNREAREHAVRVSRD